MDVLRSLKKQIHTKFIFESIHDKETIALGYLCLSELENYFKLNPNIFYEHNMIKIDLVNNLYNSTNEAISSFELLSQHFRDLYKKEDKKLMDYQNVKNKNENFGDKDEKLELKGDKIEV